MSQQGASEGAQARRGAHRVRPEEQVLAPKPALARASPLMAQAISRGSQGAGAQPAKLRPPDEPALPPAPQSWEPLAAQPPQPVAAQEQEPAQGWAEEQEVLRA